MDDSLPQHVRVVCNGTPGIFMLAENAVICGCQDCLAALPAHLVQQPQLLITQHTARVSPTEFERHAGMGSTRKWRHSIKVLEVEPSLPLSSIPDSAAPGDPAALISIGRWMDNMQRSAVPQAVQ